MTQVTLRKALRLDPETRVLLWPARDGGRTRIAALRRWGPNIEVTLANERVFVADRDSRVEVGK